jgi:hypothetical protein
MAARGVQGATKNDPNRLSVAMPGVAVADPPSAERAKHIAGERLKGLIHPAGHFLGEQPAHPGLGLSTHL